LGRPSQKTDALFLRRPYGGSAGNPDWMLWRLNAQLLSICSIASNLL